MCAKKKWLKIGARVRIVNLPDNVTNEVREYEGATGIIKSFGDYSMFHVAMDDGRCSKRFYEDELENTELSK